MYWLRYSTSSAASLWDLMKEKEYIKFMLTTKAKAGIF